MINNYKKTSEKIKKNITQRISNTSRKNKVTKISIWGVEIHTSQLLTFDNLSNIK